MAQPQIFQQSHIGKGGHLHPLGCGLWGFPFLLFVGFYFHFLFLSFFSHLTLFCTTEGSIWPQVNTQ